jgi:hypothetical protein
MGIRKWAGAPIRTFSQLQPISQKGESSDAAISDMVGEVSSNKTRAAWHGECVLESEESCHEKIPDVIWDRADHLTLTSMTCLAIYLS